MKPIALLDASAAGAEAFQDRVRGPVALVLARGDAERGQLDDLIRRSLGGSGGFGDLGAQRGIRQDA